MIYAVLTILLMAGPVSKDQLRDNDLLRIEISQWELCKTNPLSVIEAETKQSKKFIQCNVLRQLYTQVNANFVK